MKKKNRFSVPSKYIFAALALLCVGMMFASYSTGFAGSTLGRISGYVFVPVSYTHLDVYKRQAVSL